MSIFSYLVILIACILCIYPDLTNADAASDAAAAAKAAIAAAKANIVEKFEIVNLPGWDFPMPTKMYSGYLSGSDSSRLFYIYVESEDVSPADAPITLWLNGGPGCSSLDGFWEELGPFYVDETGTLQLRPYRWNRLSNMLFIEAPVGVGLSFSTIDNYANDDDRTAIESSQALTHFFTLFPERKNNKFFLTGESYAGIYVPTLAEAILNRIQANDGTWNGPSAINGIAVGNGCTGTEIGICGMYDGNACNGLYYEYKFLSGLSFFNDKLRQEIENNCDWTSCINMPVNTTAPSGSAAAHNYTLSSPCVDLLENAFDLLGHINVYDVMGECDMRDYCEDPAHDTIPTDATYQSMRGLGQTTEKLDLQTHAGRVGDNEIAVDSTSRRTTRLKSGLRKLREKMNHPTKKVTTADPNTILEHLSRRDLTTTTTTTTTGSDDDDIFGKEYYNVTSRHAGPAECIGSYNAGVWMNQHYGALGGVKSFCWGVCNRSPQWSYNSTRPNLPRDLYPRLIGNMNVMIYNGDVDACVPYTDNEAWTEGMNYNAASNGGAWHPWSYDDLEPSTMYSNQVGGYMVVYNVTNEPNDAGITGQGGFSFRTVRGAGHMVPATQPAAALEMFRHFLGYPSTMLLAPKPGDPINDKCNFIDEVLQKAQSLSVTVALFLIMFASVAIAVYYAVKAKHLQNIIDEDVQSTMYGIASDTSPTGNGNGNRNGNGNSKNQLRSGNQLDVSDRDDANDDYNDDDDDEEEEEINFDEVEVRNPFGHQGSSSTSSRASNNSQINNTISSSNNNSSSGNNNRDRNRRDQKQNQAGQGGHAAIANDDFDLFSEDVDAGRGRGRRGGGGGGGGMYNIEMSNQGQIGSGSGGGGRKGRR